VLRTLLLIYCASGESTSIITQTPSAPPDRGAFAVNKQQETNKLQLEYGDWMPETRLASIILS